MSNNCNCEFEMTDKYLDEPGSTVIDVISRIQQLSKSLPRGERKVANYIMSNYETVQHQNQNDIARAAEVSNATVTRFCHSVGCTSFRDFRVRFAQSLAVSLQYLPPSQLIDNPNDSAGELIDYVFRIIVKLLTLARNQCEPETINSMVDILASANRIVFFGVGGNSSNIAAEGANRFFRLGIPSENHSDGYFQRMLASTLQKGDVLFAISSSGNPKELIDSVAIANQYNAHTVCISKKESPLTKMVDVAIELELPEENDIFKPTASRIVYLALIDILATGVARKRGEPAKEKLRRIRTSMLHVDRNTTPAPIGD